MAERVRFTRRAQHLVGRAALYQLIEDMAAEIDEINDALAIVVKRLGESPPVIVAGVSRVAHAADTKRHEGDEKDEAPGGS